MEPGKAACSGVSYKNLGANRFIHSFIVKKRTGSAHRLSSLMRIVGTPKKRPALDALVF